MRTSALCTLVVLASGVPNFVCASEIFSDDFDDCDLSAKWSHTEGYVEPAEVNGRVWHDRISNGELDPRVEAGQSSWTVWADADYDGIFDATSETSVTSGSGGWYTLACLPAGSYDIRLATRTGWVVTTPSSGEYPVTLTMGGVQGSIDFGTQRQAGVWDFGDAPDPTYPTWDQRSGAAHLLGSGVLLGSAVDAEDNGMPGPDATGDGADDDGVTFVDPLTRGTSARVEVVASAPAFFDLWIDVGRDGIWGQAEDHVVDSEPVTTGSNSLQAKIPAESLWGPTFARARISSSADLGYRGEATDGEVEDYAVEIELEYPQDFGDAPDTFGTLGGSGGPIHELQVDVFLGRNADGETNGQPTDAADGDDDSFFDDEEGIEEFSHLVPDDPATVTVRSSAEAYLDAWVDFDQDGTWAASERILLGQPLVRGLNDFIFDVPDTAGFGDTHARFRMSDQAGASLGGLLVLGEVEDMGKIKVEALDWGDAPDLDEGPFETKLNAPSIKQDDSLGTSAHLSGDRVIVGAPHRSDGSVFIFKWDGVNWVEEVELDRADSERFGLDVDLDGTRAVIGQWGVQSKAYVYEHDGASWGFKATLRAADAHRGDAFGAGVSLSGSRTIVSAPTSQIDGRATGAAYIFEEDSGTWKEVATLATEDGDHGDSFGFAVDIGTSRAVVGALYADGETEDEGAAYVFVEAGGVWSLEQRLTPTDSGVGRHFGTCVSIDGERILVADRGNTYVFDWNPGSSEWEQRQKLLGGGSGYSDSCDLHGEWAILGQSENDDDDFNAGAVRIYRHDGAEWSLWSMLHARDAGPNHQFGTAVAVDGMRAIAGARGGDTGPLERTGAAYVYDWVLDTNHYPTLAVNDGAHHSILGNLRFGGGVDIESDGRPTDGADGDDLDNHPDEDGVTFITVLVPGDVATVQVVVTNNAYLDAWIDFDGDGDWESPSEQIFISEPVTPGLNVLNFDVPSWAVLTPQGEPTVSRFRVSFAGGLGPGGYAGDSASGEVEDHPVEILGN